MLTYPPEAMRAYCARSRYWLHEAIEQARVDIAELERQYKGAEAERITEPLREMVRELEEMQCTHKATHQT